VQETACAIASKVAGDGFVRHRPERTRLYQIIEQHYPAFARAMDAQERPLPRHVREAFDAYLCCGRLEHGFLRVACAHCRRERLVAFSCKGRGFCPSCGARRMAETAALLVDEVFPRRPIRQWVLSFPFALRYLFATRPVVLSAVLGIVQRAVSGHLATKAGVRGVDARTGSVTHIQRFGSALNLNVHFHMLFLDGVYVEGPDGYLAFRYVPAPSSAELTRLTETIAHRVGAYLERQGLLERDAEQSHLALDAPDEPGMEELLGASITYRIALGPNAGRKVFTLQTLPADEDSVSGQEPGRVGGFSLHAGVAVKAHQREKLERLCRYIARPAVSEQRLSLTARGNVRYRLKTPYRDGTTHGLFEPLDFLARLAALVPPPRVNLTRFHGVFAPNSRLRARVTPGRRGRGRQRPGTDDAAAALRRRAMSWAQRLKRVFDIDVSTCVDCGAPVRVLASIEDPAVIRRILAHLDAQGQSEGPEGLPQPRGPPLELGHLFD